LYITKGIKYLVQALPYLIDWKCNFKCRIIGDGDEKQDIENTIIKTGLPDTIIQIEPGVANHVVPQKLAEFDLYVLPCIITDDGNFDGLPVSLMEAMACGLPVITTAVAGIPELVIHEETGLIVPQKDPLAIAQAIRRLHDDREFRSRLGCNARQKVIEEFDSQATSKRLKKIFQEIVFGGPTAS
jgi:glycosyltransferase involved in cell wall biosynthesis